MLQAAAPRMPLPCQRDAVSITSMAEDTIGEAGARLCGVAYVFIHYSLLVAYFLQAERSAMSHSPDHHGLPIL